MQVADVLYCFTNQEINARSEVERMERELESARKKLEKVHQRRYQTDSETEQSGYVYSVITSFSSFYAIKIFLNFCIAINYDMWKIINNLHGFLFDVVMALALHD